MSKAPQKINVVVAILSVKHTQYKYIIFVTYLTVNIYALYSIAVDRELLSRPPMLQVRMSNIETNPLQKMAWDILAQLSSRKSKCSKDVESEEPYEGRSF